MRRSWRRPVLESLFGLPAETGLQRWDRSAAGHRHAAQPGRGVTIGQRTDRSVYSRIADRSVWYNRDMAQNSPPRTSARDRLLAAADALFYDEGINSVGIDRV